MENKKHKIITLCGSTKFKDEFIKAQREFSLKGYIVLSVGLFGHADNEYDENITDEIKETLDSAHLQKIDMSDEIFVINKDNYIGESTKKEIEHAKSKNIIVNYLEAPARLVEVTFQEMLRTNDRIKCIHPSFENSISKWEEDFSKPMTYSDFLNILGRICTSGACKKIFQEAKWYIYTDKSDEEINKNIKNISLTDRRLLSVKNKNVLPYYKDFENNWYIVLCSSYDTKNNEINVVYEELNKNNKIYNKEINEFLYTINEENYKFNSIYDLATKYGFKELENMMKNEIPDEYIKIVSKFGNLYDAMYNPIIKVNYK